MARLDFAKIKLPSGGMQETKFWRTRFPQKLRKIPFTGAQDPIVAL